MRGLLENNQEKLDHYVYFLLDKDGNVRYVGEGRHKRYKSRDKRDKEFLDILDNGGEIVIHKNGLSKSKAVFLEENLIQQYGKSLLNKKTKVSRNFLEFSELRLEFKIDGEHPSGLASVSGYKISKNKAGYWRVRYQRKEFKAHRILWCLYNCVDLSPDMVINHIDGNRSNNSKFNLEAVSTRINNIKVQDRKPKNSLGVVGVSEVKKNLLMATVYIDEDKRLQKYFSYRNTTKEKAAADAHRWRVSVLKIHDLYKYYLKLDWREDKEMSNFTNFVTKVNKFNNISGQSRAVSQEDFFNQFLLIEEEVHELEDAIEKEDFNKVLDGVVDVLVTTLGMLQKLDNLGIDIDLALKTVAEDNLKKFPLTETVAMETVEMYSNRGIKTALEFNNDYQCFVIKDMNDKVKKPIGFIGTDLNNCIPVGFKLP